MTNPSSRDRLRVVPTVIDEDGTPFIGGTAFIRPQPQQVTARPASRLTDAASPGLRESVANFVVITRALAGFAVITAVAVTVLIVAARLWGWLW